MCLTKDEIAVLRQISQHIDNQHCFHPRVVPPLALNREFKTMQDDGYILKRSSTQFQITDKGRKALRDAQLADEQSQQRNQEAAQAAAEEDRKHLRQTKREFRFSLLSALIGSAITFVLDHIVEIVEWTVKLFEKRVP